jgi:transcriptional regulator with XRE-family HTH domain
MYVKLSPEKVRELREERDISRRELAEAAHVSVDTVRRIETGKGPVRLKTARAVALLGLDLEDPRILRASGAASPLDSDVRRRV